MRLRTLALVPAAALLLSACGSADSADESTSPSTTTADSAPSAGPQELIALGTPFDVQDRNGQMLGTVTILDVEKNPVCTELYGEPRPAAGTYVAVQARVETTANHDPMTFMRMTERDFSVVDTSGVTKSAFVDSDLCTGDRDGFDIEFTAASAYEGWVLLDSPDPDGTLIYKPQYSLQGPTYRVADLSAARDGGGAIAPAAPVTPTTSAAPPVDPQPQPATSPPVGYTAGPVGDPQPLAGKVIDYCMDSSMYQSGTTMFTDGTTGWTVQCSTSG